MCEITISRLITALLKQISKNYIIENIQINRFNDDTFN